MTNRLYYDQSYLTEFDAQVLSCRMEDGTFDVVLDQSAFYPTSGGQPFDTGMIGTARVTDVRSDGDIIIHTCDSAVDVGARVHCKIDWDRRFDHMQQHAADHLIAGYLYRLYGAYTVGLHLGRDHSTIDVVMPDGSLRLDDGQIEQIEDLANRDIQRDLPVRCFFPDPGEMKALPLRKEPTVEDHVRVVLIGDEECVACGGTHVSSIGQVGLVKILWTAPSRGKLRLAYVAGMRAVGDYRVRYRQSEAASALLSCQASGLMDALQAQQERLRALEWEIGQFQRERALSRADALLSSARDMEDGWQLIAATVPDADMDSLKEIAKKLIQVERRYVLLDGGGPLLFARSAGGGADMGKLMKDAASACAGRGGGRADFAQGAAERGALDVAVEMIIQMHGALLRS